MIQGLQLPPDPDHRRDADCQVQVRCFRNNGLSQQIVDSHRTPLTLTCPQRKRSRPNTPGETKRTFHRKSRGYRLSPNVTYAVSGSVREFPISSSRSRVREPFVSACSTDTTRHTSASEVTPAAAFCNPSASNVVIPPRCAA